MNKISILLPNLNGGGAEKVSVDLARAFNFLGYKVEFVLMQAIGDFLPDVRRDYTVVDLGVYKIRDVPWSFARYLRSRHPTAIIANMWPLTSAAVIGRCLSGKKCTLLLVEHCTLSQQYMGWGTLHKHIMRLSMATTYRFADCLAAVSEGAAKDNAKLSGLPEHRVAVLHNPIPCRSMPTTDACSMAKAFWNCPQGERILTVGSLKESKNHPALLRAFARLPRPHARLMLLGQGGKEAELRTLAIELGINDRVIFAGFHTDPSPFYATSDLFVLSSDNEGLPTVLVEALSFGLPVVSTDCPFGPAEILENGRWGRLVPVGNVNALAKAMDESLSVPADGNALKRRAADFLPEIAACKYLDLFKLPYDLGAK